MTSHVLPAQDLPAALLSAYLLETGSTNSAAARNPTKKLRAAVEAVAAELRSAGRSPEGYVRYVVQSFAKRNGGRMPFVWQVFGAAALEGWLPEYARRAREVLEPPTYAASPDRRERYYAGYKRQDALIERVWVRHYPHQPFPRYAAPSPLPRPSARKPGDER